MDKNIILERDGKKYCIYIDKIIYLKSYDKDRWININMGAGYELSFEMSLQDFFNEVNRQTKTKSLDNFLEGINNE